MQRRRRFAVIAVTGALILAACSSNDSPSTDASNSSSSSSTDSFVETSSAEYPTDSSITSMPIETVPIETVSQTLATVAISAQPSTGCTAGNTIIPEGATQGTVIDVDGDGKPDTAWIFSAPDGAVTVGVATAAGGGATRRFDSASPVSRSILVVDTDNRAPVEILASTGRSVQLWAFLDCAIVDIVNPQGKPYDFSLGFTDIGTGVGCVSIDGHQQLVGLDAKERGSTVDWSRTVVDLDRTTARNGATMQGTFTRPGDDLKIDLLHQVTCGDFTMLANGLTAGS